MLRMFALLLALALCVFSVSCRRTSTAASESKTLRLAILTWPGYALAAVGQEQGFFGDLKIEHTILDDNTARYAAFESGQFDAMLSSSTDTVFENAQGILQGAKVVALSDVSLGGDGMIARHGIESPRDLQGNRVAYVRCAPAFILLVKALEGAGLSLNDIQSVPIEDPSMAAQALLSGQIDAAMSWEPFLTQMAKAGRGKILTTSRDYPGLVQDIIVAHPKLLARPDVLEKFLRGWLRSAEFCQAHPEKAWPAIARVLQMKVEDLKTIWPVCRVGTADVQREYLSGAPSKLEQAMDEAGEIYERLGVIKKATPARELVDLIAIKRTLDQEKLQ